jgi:alanine dehydrogenase
MTIRGGQLLDARQAMRIGIPTEIKPDERRVAATPAAARELVSAGAEVLVQSGAGLGARLADSAYVAAGARIAPDAESTWGECEIIMKVKEPQPEELARLRHDHVLFAYLHLAPDPDQTRDIVASGATAIAFETVRDHTGGLPLLAPMSEVAGRLSAQFAATHLLAHEGGRGILAGGVPGVRPARAVVIGGGVVGTNAARVLLGLGFDVTILDVSVPRLRQIADIFDERVHTVAANDHAMEEELSSCDVVIGAVLRPGALAPQVIRREHLALLGEGAVVIDVAIDQGGCFETSRPTTHTAPTFVLDGVVHNCVANMPGAVPWTSTHALVNATLPYALSLATRGVDGALAADPGFSEGVNVSDGEIVNRAVVDAYTMASVVA